MLGCVHALIRHLLICCSVKVMKQKIISLYFTRCCINTALHLKTIKLQKTKRARIFNVEERKKEHQKNTTVMISKTIGLRWYHNLQTQRLKRARNRCVLRIRTANGSTNFTACILPKISPLIARTLNSPSICWKEEHEN